jgi:hypothetical protein
MEKARAVKEAYTDELMSKANVVGVGVGLLERDDVRTQTIAVVVMVKQKVPRGQLPLSRARSRVSLWTCKKWGRSGCSARLSRTEAT